MPYCTSCGKQYEAPARFCIHCGNALKKPVATAATYENLQPAITTPQPISIPVPKPQPANYGAWFVKNKVLLIGIALLAVAGFTVKKIFFAPTPGKDAIAIAKQECTCSTNSIAKLAEEKKKFIYNFDSYQFKSSYNARQMLAEIERNVQATADSCRQASSRLLIEKRQKYTTDYSLSRIFEDAYYKEQRACNVNLDELNEVTARIEKKLSRFTGFKPEVQVKPVDAIASPAADTMATATNYGLYEIQSDDGVKKLLRDFFTKENGISSPDQINDMLRFYDFPLERYYTFNNMNSQKLAAIYKDSFFDKLSMHKTSGYENKFTIRRMPDGGCKVIVGSKFEFSTKENPSAIQQKEVYTTYVLTKDGKIKSVYQLM